MKQNRAREAKELLAGRGSEAKKVFQRNSSQGQMNFGVGQLVRKPNSGQDNNVAQGPPPVKPSAPAPIISEAPPSVPSDPPSNDDIAPPPPAFDSSPGMSQNIFVLVQQLYYSAKTEEELSSAGVHRASPAKVDITDVTEKLEDDVTEEDAEIAANTNMESYGTCAVALYDYQVLTGGA